MSASVSETMKCSLDDDSVLVNVEEQPEFPGGIQALMKFLSDNLKYPPAAMKNGIEGRVLVRFVVTQEGKIENAEIVRAVNPDLEKEALRVVNHMPKWKPGKVEGKPVRVLYTLPVMFRLNRDENKGSGGAANAPRPGMGGPGGQFGGRGGQFGGRGGFKPAPKFGSYSLEKNFEGNNVLLLGMKDARNNTLKLTITNKMKTNNEALERIVSEKVFGISGSFGDAAKEFLGKFHKENFVDCKLSQSFNIEECYNKNGVVCVIYRELNANNLTKISDYMFFVYDTNASRIISLQDLVSNALAAHLKGQGIDPESTTNIKIEENGFVVTTPASIITIDAEKLKANLSDYALGLLGM